jgi:MOSC domain-containing protein YiiM
MPQPTVVSIHVGQPRELHDGQRAYMTAIAKDDRVGPVWVGKLNMEGDLQADTRHHGGPDRAVLGYSVANLARWREEHTTFDFPEGAFGENFSIDGLDENSVCVGDVWVAGEVVLEVTYPRVPCYKLNGRSGIPTLLNEVIATGRIGWFHRVLQEGRVTAGATLVLRDRPHPDWTIARAYEVFKSLQNPKAAPCIAEARAMMAMAVMPESWRHALNGMVERAEARG